MQAYFYEFLKFWYHIVLMSPEHVVIFLRETPITPNFNFTFSAFFHDKWRTFRSSCWKTFSEKSRKIHRKIPESLFSIKLYLEVRGCQFYLKQTPAKVISCQFWKMFQKEHNFHTTTPDDCFSTLSTLALSGPDFFLSATAQEGGRTIPLT